VACVNFIFNLWSFQIIFLHATKYYHFLADYTNVCDYAILRQSVCRLSVTLCIVAKRCILEQKLLLSAYRKSYVRNLLVPKWMTLTFD